MRITRIKEDFTYLSNVLTLKFALYSEVRFHFLEALNLLANNDIYLL